MSVQVYEGDGVARPTHISIAGNWGHSVDDDCVLLKILPDGVGDINAIKRIRVEARVTIEFAGDVLFENMLVSRKRFVKDAGHWAIWLED